jgi:hypothetical protein
METASARAWSNQPQQLIAARDNIVRDYFRASERSQANEAKFRNERNGIRPLRELTENWDTGARRERILRLAGALECVLDALVQMRPRRKTSSARLEILLCYN